MNPASNFNNSDYLGALDCYTTAAIRFEANTTGPIPRLADSAREGLDIPECGK